ncbi:hypothetical protein [Nostoc sp. ChiSLP03a]|uniref:hypothetical protein n=1 Tax=Nostoc sp. ChiSLP03a TaxID=3075380 RepID=UPI002AD4727C|nr:hypothetical protein [Nostoc sp. ChiSLP03a]MDZ8215580.1 hypothetical protein [Nostoc sp. ChiSLP03a]
MSFTVSTDINVSTEFFATIPSYQNRKVDIYKDAKATDGGSDQKFYYTPLFSLVSDASGEPKVEIDGTTVEVWFQCYTQQLHNLVFNEIGTRIENSKLRSNQINLIPLVGIEIKPESKDVGSYTYPEVGLSLITMNEQHTAKFEFSEVGAATNFAQRIKNKNEDFNIKLKIASVSVKEDIIDINASDFKKVDWKNFVNDKNAGENIDADNQYFTINQIANSFESILRRINITVITEGAVPGALVLDEKNKLLDIFIQDLTKVVELDCPLTGSDDIFISKDSFKPDVINKENISISNAMTSAVESVMNRAEEDIKDSGKWDNRESLLEQLDKEYQNKKGNIDTAGSVNVFKIFGGSAKGSGSFEFTNDTVNKLKEATKTGSSATSRSEARSSMQSELKNLLQTQSNYDWGFEGEKIIPKKIKLRRIISGEFKASHQLFQRTRTIQRSFTENEFIISSKRNIIGLQESSTSTNTLELTLDSTHTSIDLGQQLESLVARYQVVNVRFKLDDTGDRLNFTWNHPFSIPENHTLSITGPHENGPTEDSLKVQINMTKTPALSWHGSDDPGNRRIPERVFVGKNATLEIAGIRLYESANDTRELSQTAYNGGALFDIGGDFGTVILIQSHVRSTEDIVGFGSQAYGRAKFGWTYVNKSVPSPRDILILKTYTGWAFRGAGGVVSGSYTTLGDGVSFHDFPGIIYLN